MRNLFCLLMVIGVTAAHAEVPAVAQAPPAPVSYRAPEQVVKLPPPPNRYAAPPGFGGHRWGEARTAFTCLPDKPQGIGAAWSQGKVTSIDIDCRSAGPQRCSVNDFLLAAWKQRVDGGGFFALSEYYIETQGFKLPGTGVVMWPVVYQFCANWQSHFKEVPKDFEKLNRFCGMRLLFQTETLAQLSDLPEDHVTRYDLVLSELISRYGKPANFTWRGHVTVEPVNGPIGPASRGQRKFDTWRWCPAPRDGLMTRCPASIVLTLDPEQGQGIVLFSTPELWQYAAAREDGPAQPDALYTLLHALSLKHRTAYARREEQRHKAEQEAATAKAGRGSAIP